MTRNTGKRLWHCEGPSKEAATTPAFGERIGLRLGRVSHQERALHPGRRLGRREQYPRRLAAEEQGRLRALAAAGPGLLYLVDDGGLAMCLDARTGEMVWSKRLEGGFSASPVLAGGNIYVPNEAGMMYVFKPGRSFQLVARNDLGDGGFATPAICGSRIYLRTLHRLYCIGER